MDLSRVDVAELVQIESRVMGEGSTSIRPERCLRELAELRIGLEEREAIDAPSDPLDRPPALHVDKTMRIEPGFPGIGRRDQALLLRSDRRERVVVASGHGSFLKRCFLQLDQHIDPSTA